MYGGNNGSFGGMQNTGTMASSGLVQPGGVVVSMGNGSVSMGGMGMGVNMGGTGMGMGGMGMGGMGMGGMNVQGF